MTVWSLVTKKEHPIPLGYRVGAGQLSLVQIAEFRFGILAVTDVSSALPFCKQLLDGHASFQCLVQLAVHGDREAGPTGQIEPEAGLFTGVAVCVRVLVQVAHMRLTNSTGKSPMFTPEGRDF